DSFYIADTYDDELAKVRQERVRLENTLADFRASVDCEMIQVVGRILSMNGDITVTTTDGKMISQLESMVQLEKVQETSDFIRFQLVEDGIMRQVRQELAQVREEEEKHKHGIRVKLTSVIADYGPRLHGVLERLAFLDVLLAKAKFAVEIDGMKPQLCEDSIIRITEGRHPLVEEEVTQGGHDYTPLCLEVSSGVTLITGPNMGGKTASLKTIGLLTAMAQYGLLVPARSMDFRPRK
ncbi:MAG TPA: DNA mismatch repair protein MutS, partial [Firmicutes bacterium]|nr:DNA mismatch repair protein MutS [Bacillota bacterium]